MEVPDEFSTSSQLIDEIRSYNQPPIVTQTAKPKISIRTTSLFEKPKSENMNQRTMKRSQSTIQREAENIVQPNRDDESHRYPYPSVSYEQSNALKKIRYENQTQNNALPVRTNDPRLNRIAEIGNSSIIYKSPTPVVSMPVITPKLQHNMDAILHRCTKALDLIRNLKQSATTPMVLYKYSESKAQQQSSERAKKSPLILSTNNVQYMLQASENSITECQLALLSRQFQNISLPLQSTMRVLGADINKISIGVAKAELKRQKEESQNASMGIVYLSDKKFRIIGTQTEYDNFQDKVPPKTFETKGISCNICVTNADKSAQTVTNTDGFHFSIESLLLLTPAQRRGLQDFKKVSCFRLITILS